jgi:hypothetical protein
VILLVTAAAILEDKARTTGGQATSINVRTLLEAGDCTVQIRRSTS